MATLPRRREMKNQVWMHSYNMLVEEKQNYLLGSMKNTVHLSGSHTTLISQNLSANPQIYLGNFH